MPKWRKTVNIKDLLSDDDSNENARVVATAVAGRLRRFLRPEIEDSPDLEIVDIVEDFEDIGESDDADAADFNATLSRLYDWADAERVWLGL